MLTLKAAAATIVVQGEACLLIPYYILTATHYSLTPPIGFLQLIAILVGAVGVFMVVWVFTAFVHRGKGTPIPIEPPTRLVITGFYRYVLNSMYVGPSLPFLPKLHSSALLGWPPIQ